MLDIKHISKKKTKKPVHRKDYVLKHFPLLKTKIYWQKNNTENADMYG